MKWSVLAVLVVAALLGLAAIAGTFIPREHRVARTASVERPRADVWALLTDYPGYGTWMPGVRRVTPAPPGPAGERWQLATAEGVITIEVTELKAPERLRTRIVDDGLPFGGSWAFDLSAAPTGTVVTLTEEGWIGNPLFRFFAHRVFGIDRTVEQTLRALRRAATSSRRTA